ncbi:WXG100 family type VII secretion target [Mycobacterium sp. NPDC003449]
MPGQLNVNTDAAVTTAHAVSDDAAELRTELERIAGEWQSVAHGWSGAAASAYTDIWEEWHEGATRLVDVLAESARALSQAAVHYDQQDASSAQAVESLSREMGL